jgi:very-short-patch-repair endonuclease
LAARQHGVISREQVLAVGLSDDQIEKALAASNLHRVFRGVYAVGHPGIGRRGRMHAAWLSCGPGATISHGSALELLGLTDRQLALIHLIGPGEHGRRIDGIRWHRVPLPGPTEVAIRHGIRCTTVARTLVDLAGSLGRSSLRGLIEEAAVRRSLDVEAIDSILARRRRRGAPALRALLTPWRAAAGDLPALRSRLEARLWPRLVERGLAFPDANARIDLDGVRFEVDFVWHERMLVVETDGEEAHATRSAFQRDRWRDQLLQAAGYRVMRVTWRQLEREPEQVVSRICSALES